MTEDHPSDGQRFIELEVEVPGTAEQVWAAIATGPGISSWYVPHVVEERAGGAATASFGPGPEMQIAGRVAAWEPPRRIVFDGGEGVDGLAFEWLVEARDGGTCVVRLVNSGFGSGAEWDDQYDQMREGWQLFLLNLRLHLTYFAGQHATSMLPMGMWPGPRQAAWATLTEALGIPTEPSAGQHVQVRSADAPPLAGTVIEATTGRIALLLDEPAPGTAIIAAEALGDQVGVSLWSYLYGNDAAAAVERDEPAWRQWLERNSIGDASPDGNAAPELGA
jgi:uncharacterized protein YndB with AHSA1/START domain